jgi:hypothetical protein
MSLSINSSKREQLLELAMVIRGTTPDCWLFPDENVVQGFLGTGPIFIVGIRPSTSKWDTKNPIRRGFYDLLAKIGAANAHLTDIYKRPGHSEETEVESEEDFQEHLLFFRNEIEILCPTRVVAMGVEASNRLRWHTPELEPIVRMVQHFSRPIRYGKVSQYEPKLRAAIEGV